MDDDIPEYLGPAGKRKIYVGCEPDKVAAAREMVNRKHKSLYLLKKQRDLGYRIADIKRMIYDAVRKADMLSLLDILNTEL